MLKPRRNCKKRSFLPRRRKKQRMQRRYKRTRRRQLRAKQRLKNRRRLRLQRRNWQRPLVVTKMWKRRSWSVWRKNWRRRKKNWKTRRQQPNKQRLRLFLPTLPRLALFLKSNKARVWRVPLNKSFRRPAKSSKMRSGKKTKTRSDARLIRCHVRRLGTTLVWRNT